MNFPVLLGVEDTALLELFEQCWSLAVGALERVNARLQARGEGFKASLKTFGLSAF